MLGRANFLLLNRKSCLNQTLFSLFFYFGKSKILLKSKILIKSNMLKLPKYCTKIVRQNAKKQKTQKTQMSFFAKNWKWKYLHFVWKLLNKLEFRPVKNLKRAVWISVLWQMNKHIEKMARIVHKTVLYEGHSFRNTLYY